jgi:hypothetical protein
MKAAEILRSLADVIDRAETGTAAAEVPTQIQKPSFHKVEVPNEEQGDPYATMVSPLQQKLELLKKAAGVESAYDEQDREAADPLDQMKKMAGLQTVMVASEDNDIEG